MSGTGDEPGAVDVSRLLAGAATAIGSVRFCWLVTGAEDGFASIRPMGRLPHEPDDGDDEWTMHFITDRRSRKAADIRRADRATVVFQNDAALAYVTLIGTATLHESEPEVRRRWKNAYSALFADPSNAIFVDVDVERMELWIRGVTPEPFGMHTTTLERDAGGGWRLVASQGTAVSHSGADH